MWAPYTESVLSKHWLMCLGVEKGQQIEVRLHMTQAGLEPCLDSSSEGGGVPLPF